MYEIEPINLYDNFLFTLFTERIWPVLSPVFWVLNVLGMLERSSMQSIKK
jgi:hypothetical protein